MGGLEHTSTCRKTLPATSSSIFKRPRSTTRWGFLLLLCFSNCTDCLFPLFSVSTLKQERSEVTSPSRLLLHHLSLGRLRDPPTPVPECTIKSSSGPSARFQLSGSWLDPEIHRLSALDCRRTATTPRHAPPKLPYP